MKPALSALAAAVFLLACPAAAAEASTFPDPVTLTRETALTADVGTLARDALAAIASRLVEVERPTFTGLAGYGAALGGLRFAAAAESAGWPGLCKGTAVWINLLDPHAPVHVSTLYKVVGDLAPLPDMWNDAYGAELQRKCAGAGRVIPTESADFGQAVFFSVGEADPGDVWTASRALQIAISRAATGSGVSCVEEPAPDWLDGLPGDDPEILEDRQNREGCLHPAATVAGLSLDRLLAIETEACPDAGPDFHCVEATFLRHADFNRQVGWLVLLRYRDGADYHRDDIREVKDVRLTPSWTVYD